MHARLDNGNERLLTRTGLDWTSKHPAIELPATITRTSPTLIWIKGHRADLRLNAYLPREATDEQRSFRRPPLCPALSLRQGLPQGRI